MGSELESDTTAPPIPAGEVSVTVPVPVWVLTMTTGLTVRLARPGGNGMMTMLAWTFVPEYEAVTVTGVDTNTFPAITGNVADTAPCGTVTVEGTPAAEGFELESDTATPPVPAGAVSVTVPVADWPLRIVLGLTATLERPGGGGLIVMAKPSFTLR